MCQRAQPCCIPSAPGCEAAASHVPHDILSQISPNTSVTLSHCRMPTAADVERPPLKSPPSAPAGKVADKEQHSDQANKEQHSSSSGEHVHRSKSDPTGIKQRPSALPQKDTLTESQKQTLAHVQVGDQKRGGVSFSRSLLNCSEFENLSTSRRNSGASRQRHAPAACADSNTVCCAGNPTHVPLPLHCQQCLFTLLCCDALHCVLLCCAVACRC